MHRSLTRHSRPNPHPNSTPPCSAVRPGTLTDYETATHLGDEHADGVHPPKLSPEETQNHEEPEIVRATGRGEPGYEGKDGADGSSDQRAASSDQSRFESAPPETPGAMAHAPETPGATAAGAPMSPEAAAAARLGP